jgi:hypothetical protein
VDRLPDRFEEGVAGEREKRHESSRGADRNGRDTRFTKNRHGLAAATIEPDFPGKL